MFSWRFSLSDWFTFICFLFIWSSHSPNGWKRVLPSSQVTTYSCSLWNSNWYISPKDVLTLNLTFIYWYRSRLSYEQFSAFLANIKELNAQKQTREVKFIIYYLRWKIPVSHRELLTRHTLLFICKLLGNIEESRTNFWYGKQRSLSIISRVA